MMVDAAGTVAVRHGGPMYQRIMTFAADATPVLLIAELEGLAFLPRIAVHSLVLGDPV